LRAESFFCNLDKLYGGLGIGFQFLVIKALDLDWIRIRIGSGSGSELVSSLKRWIRIRKNEYGSETLVSTSENSFWGETLQLLTMFNVVYYVIWVASTFENSFWRETL
jgi:hypothetical protein